MTTIEGTLSRLDHAELRHGDLKVGQNFEEKGFERLVGTVDFVDQQDRRSFRRRFQSLQQRTLDQIARGKNIVLDPLLVMLAGGLGEPDRHHLGGVAPLIDRRCDVEPLVALQADQSAAQRRRQDLGDLGLADACLAFKEERPAEAKA